ncbi:MAG TPA: hypothetical protein VK054_08540, partial [Beutenbergiaceae bacterium]|nr:hypothetical protein [Beutenbergiaceae bacterium]
CGASHDGGTRGASSAARSQPGQGHALVGAVLPEQHDVWAEGRRYMNLTVLAESQKVGLNNDSTEVTTTDPAAIAAQQNRLDPTTVRAVPS